MTRKSVKNKRSRKAGRGVLILITGFFLTSGVLRLGSGTGSAIAREIQSLSHPETRTVADVTPVACEPDEEGIGDLLAALKKREARVAEQEAALEIRMRVLAAAEEGAKKNLAALEAAEQQLKATMALADTAAEDDLSRLTSVYENMKAKDAAKLFEEMDPQFSAGFLGRMRPDAAAAIFAGMTPAKAYSISVILAGRNAEVPTE